MKLLLNKTSPYARLVMTVVHEKGLVGAVEMVWVDPWATPVELVGQSPFSKVPVLIARDGMPLSESAAICDYLDEVSGGRRLLPASGAERLAVQRKFALGRGLIDAAFGLMLERKYHAGAPVSELARRWHAALVRAMPLLEQADNLTPATGAVDLGDLALAVGLAYTSFRIPDLAWRTSSPRLAAWLDAMAERPSLEATRPD